MNCVRNDLCIRGVNNEMKADRLGIKKDVRRKSCPSQKARCRIRNFKFLLKSYTIKSSFSKKTSVF